jgi:hypothetical protein
MIEPILNMYKIKYEELKSMIQFKEGKYLNIFINLNSVLNSFYNSKITAPALRELNGKETLIFSSEIINIIAHYRHFFWKYYKVPTTFYIYYNNGTIPIKNKKYNLTYMEHQAIQRSENNPEFGQVNELLNKNIKLIKMIIEYIYDSYFIENNNIDIGIMIYKIIKDTEASDRLNLVLTRDKYDFQLLRYNPKKIGLIYMAPKHIEWLNPIDIMKKVIKIDNIIDEQYIHYLGLLYAIGGLPSRSLYGIKGIGIKKAFKIIQKYWNNKDFFTTNISDFIIKEILTESNLSDCIDYIINQYKCIDIEFGVNYLLNDADNFYLSENIYKNRYDNESIIDLNDKYYYNHPINLIYLAEGCNLKKKSWNYSK